MHDKLDWSMWPQYRQEHAEAVSRVMSSGQLFAAEEVRRFEEEYSNYIGSGCKTIGVGNATQALHLALAALGIGIGDEVIVTAYSWISTASCILMQNAVPVFVDINPENFGLNPAEIKKSITPYTKAVVVTHMLGYQAEIEEIRNICKKNSLYLIEDASHAHGAKADGQSLGTFGDIGVFSLHQRKSLSAGEGGVLVTNNKKIYEKLYRLRSFGDEELSYNYRMTEMSAALARVSLQTLENENEERRKYAEISNDYFKFNSQISSVLARYHKEAVYYAVALKVDIKTIELDTKLQELQKYGIPIRKTWDPLNQHIHFNPVNKPARGLPWQLKEYKGIVGKIEFKNLDLPIVTTFCPNKILELYCHPGLTEKKLLDGLALINKILSY